MKSSISLPVLIMKKALLRFCVLLGGISCLFAQDDEAGGDRPAKVRGRVAWFVYTSMPEGVENPVTVMTGKDIAELTLSKRMVSERVKIPADGILRLVREAENQEDPVKPSYATIAQAKVPEGMSKALIILIPKAQPEGDLVFEAKVQDLAAFKGGDWLFLNLTNVDVGVQLGETKMKITPAGKKIFNAPVLDEPMNMPVLYSFFHPVKKEWKLLSASTVVLRGTRRELCIFSVDSRFDRIDYHGITFPVAPEPPGGG
jgi:hypothetical protein